MLSPVTPFFLVSGLYARATSAAGICTSARQDRRSGFQFSPSASYDSYELGTQLSSARSLDTVHLAPDRTRNVPLDIPVDGMLLISPLGSDDDGDSPALTPVSPPVRAAPPAHPVPTVPPAARPSPVSFTSPRAPRGLPSPTASPPLADDSLPGLVDDSSDDSDSSAPSRRLSGPSPPPASPPAKKQRAKRHRRRPSSVLPASSSVTQASAPLHTASSSAFHALELPHDEPSRSRVASPSLIARPPAVAAVADVPVLSNSPTPSCANTEYSGLSYESLPRLVPSDDPSPPPSLAPAASARVPSPAAESLSSVESGAAPRPLDRTLPLPAFGWSPKNWLHSRPVSHVHIPLLANCREYLDDPYFRELDPLLRRTLNGEDIGVDPGVLHEENLIRHLRAADVLMRPASLSLSPSQANLGGEAVHRAAEAEEEITRIEEEPKRCRDTTWMSGEGTRRKPRKGAKPPSAHQLNVIKRDMLRAMIRESVLRSRTTALERSPSIGLENFYTIEDELKYRCDGVPVVESETMNTYEVQHRHYFEYCSSLRDRDTGATFTDFFLWGAVGQPISRGRSETDSYE